MQTQIYQLITNAAIPMPYITESPTQVLDELRKMRNAKHIAFILESAIEEFTLIEKPEHINNFMLSHFIFQQITDECTDGCNPANYINDIILIATLCSCTTHGKSHTKHFTYLYQSLCDLYSHQALPIH